jgi:putative endonuclease
VGKIPQWVGQLRSTLKGTAHRGQRAEQLAARYLQRQGLQLVAQNYRTPLGEIDLICEDRDQLVFVEVRYKASDRNTSAAESITRSKQLKVMKAARQYVQQHDPAGLRSCRFDVVAMSGSLKEPEIEWIEHAFY